MINYGLDLGEALDREKRMVQQMPLPPKPMKLNWDKVGFWICFSIVASIMLLLAADDYSITHEGFSQWSDAKCLEYGNLWKDTINGPKSEWGCLKEVKYRLREGQAPVYLEIASEEEIKEYTFS